MVDFNNVDLMGFPGDGKISELLQNQYKHQPEGDYINKRLINNIHSGYLSLLSEGYKPADYDNSTQRYSQGTYKMSRIIGDNLNISNVVVLFFFYNLWDLARKGKIPLYVLDPEGFKKKEKIKKSLLPENKLLNMGKGVLNYTKNTIAVAVVGGTLAVALYFSSKAKK